MKKVTLLSLVIVAMLFAACSNQKTDASQGENDSTAVVEKLEQEEVDNMVEIINAMSAAMDSIQIQEKMIFNMQEGTPKNQVIAKLKAFQELLASKQAEIDKLNIENKSQKNTIANLKKMVAFLQGELDTKSKQIAEMVELMEKKDARISSLRYNLNEKEKEADYLKDQNFEQDQQLNTVYYIIGTKDELKEKGLMKGGFLSKKRADYANIDKSYFIKRDMRGLDKIDIDSKKAKIITEKPASSYTLTKNDNGTTTLTITDKEAFWKASPFLIIQK